MNARAGIAGELLVEAHAEHPIDGGWVRRASIFSRKPVIRARSHQVVEHLLRMRLEDHQHRGKVEVLSQHREALQKRPVSDVNPVEHADGEHAAVVARTKVVQAADELQDAFAPLRPTSVRAPLGSREPFAAVRRVRRNALGSAGDRERDYTDGGTGPVIGRRKSRGRRPLTARAPNHVTTPAATRPPSIATRPSPVRVIQSSDDPWSQTRTGSMRPRRKPAWASSFIQPGCGR